MFVKKYVFVLNAVVGSLIILFIVLRLHNTGIIDLRLRKINPKKFERNTRRSVTTTPTVPLKVPWRFHIEEDGFVFPQMDNKERFLTYEQLNGSWTKQILQFENANVFAYLLKRTLLVPPLLPYKTSIYNITDYNKVDSFSMSEIIDFDLLSSMVKLGEVNSRITNEIKIMDKYSVCHDPRLGFWVDYIPSVENIQTWRILKEQYFYPLKLNLNGLEREYVCPGTENYADRWGPPLRVKALYRGILTELNKRKEELIYFQGDTLDTTHIRFFNKQRAKKAQELLLFYIRFSKDVTKQTKRFANLLGFGYTAILANHISDTNGISTYISNEVRRLNISNTSMNVLVVSKSSHKPLFDVLSRLGYNLIFAEEFIRRNALLAEEVSFVMDKVHILSLLLCAYATHFIGLPGTSDLYFVEHLRLQDVGMTDGLVTDKVSVRWAKHTTRDKADERKILIKTTESSKLDKIRTAATIRNFTKIIPVNVTNKKVKILMKKVILKPKKKLDRLNSMVCSFCNYVRHVTGQHGCPSMKQICG